MSAPFRFDRRFAFAVAPEALWSTVAQTHRYPEWWSWLRELDGAELREGAVARCVIQAPLPYALRFTVTIERMVWHERVETMVRGDLEGPAILEVRPDGDGASTARLAWELELRDRMLRPMALVARPVMVWAHDRVVELGLEQFEQRGLNGARS